MKVTHYFTASLTAPTPAVLYAVKGDGARMAVARLMAGAEAWTVPEGVTAGISYTLPDKTPGYYDRLEDGTPACMIAGNLVSAVIAPVLTGQAGAVKASIVLRDADGDQVATFPFQLRVEQAPGIVDAESVPAMGNGFEGKLFYGGPGGALTALALGDGVRVETTEDGTLALVAEGGSGGGGGIDEEKDPTVPAWAKQPQKPAYTAQEVGAMPAGTKIPGKTSELTNDAGFVTKAVSDLANYYTKVQMQELIAAIPRFRVTVVQQLPAAGEELVLYLVPFATAEGQYLEYIWADGRWEIIGSQRVDLTGYATEEWVQEYVEEHSGQNVDLTGYAKEQWVRDNYQPKGEYLTEVPSGYATEEFVKNRIAEAELGGEEVDLSGYAQKSELPTKVSQLQNDAGYLTAVPDGYAKTEDIPKKPADIGAQPAGNYALKTEIPSVPVQSVNGKTGAVNLTAADVGARAATWMPTAQEVGALPSTYTPPDQTAAQVGADPKGTAAAAVSAHNTNAAAHNDIRQELAAINARLTAFFDSDNQTLDELSEIVAYITSNKSLIDAITTSKVSVADIINNLTTNVANKPLSAAQGVVIKGLIDGLSASLANYQPKGNYALASAVPTKVSQLANDKGYLTEHQDISHLTPTVKAVTKAEYSELTPDAVAQLYADGIRMLIVEDGYTNLVPKSTDAAGNAYRGCGYLDGYRLTSSGGLTASDNCCVSGFMPYTHGSTIRIVGSCGDVLTNGGQYVGVYDASYNLIKMDYASSIVATWDPRADGLYEMTIDTSKMTAWSGAKYFRVSCLMCVGADLVVTVNEPIGLEV